MSSSANSSPETADERARVLLAAASRASFQPVAGEAVSISALIQPDIIRLSEVEKLAIRQMILGLVEQVEQEMRARMLATPDLPGTPEFTASLGASHVAIAWPALSAAGLPDDPDLAAILVRRARAYTIIRRLRRFGRVTDPSVIEQLTDHPEASIATLAMQLLIAESRANDRFDDPRLSKNDLPGPVAERLIWTIAAALRDYGRRFADLDHAGLETVIAEVASAMADEHEDADALEPAAMALAAELVRHDLVSAALCADALNGARLHLYVAMLATRARLPFAAAWDMAIMADAPTHMVMLKSLNFDRDTASQLLAGLLRASSADENDADNRAAEWLQAYDSWSATDSETVMRPWRLNSSYRSALARLAAADQDGWA